MANTKHRIRHLEDKIKPRVKRWEPESSVLREAMGLKKGESIRIHHNKGYAKLVLEGLDVKR